MFRPDPIHPLAAKKRGPVFIPLFPTPHRYPEQVVERFAGRMLLIPVGIARDMHRSEIIGKGNLIAEIQTGRRAALVRTDFIPVSFCDFEIFRLVFGSPELLPAKIVFLHIRIIILFGVGPVYVKRIRFAVRRSGPGNIVQLHISFHVTGYQISRSDDRSSDRLFLFRTSA